MPSASANVSATTTNAVGGTSASLWAVVLLALASVGCGSLHGPSVDFTAPEVVGRAVDATTGAPVRNARVGRILYSPRRPGGEYRKGGEELLYLQSFASTDADGRFRLASQKAALLFRFGDFSLNLRLAIQGSRHQSWLTNYPVSVLGTNDVAPPRIDAGEIRLDPR